MSSRFADLRREEAERERAKHKAAAHERHQRFLASLSEEARQKLLDHEEQTRAQYTPEQQAAFQEDACDGSASKRTVARADVCVPADHPGSRLA